MIIFVLPGFSSHNPNRKFHVLKKYLPECTIVGLTYPSNNPDALRKYFFGQIDSAILYYKDPDISFLGTSLGGFWSQFLADQYNTKCIMINPSLDPSNTLTEYIGLNKNCYTNDIMNLDLQSISIYHKYYINIPTVDTLLLLDKGDELFDYKETLKKMKHDKVFNVTFDGGDHTFQHIKESLPYISSFLSLDMI